MEIAKKISNKLFADLEIGEVVTIAGVVHSYTEEEGTHGSYKRFKGEFALRHKGQNVMASTMFLPEIAADLLAAEVVRGATAGGDGFKGVEFAIDLGKKPDANPYNARGYQWAVYPKIEATPTTSRALALLGDPPQIVLTLEAPAAPAAVPANPPAADSAESAETGKGKGKGK